MIAAVRTRAAGALSALVAIAACAGPSAPGARPMVATELYFGLSRPDGTVVRAEEYQDFLSSYISDRFPDGLTTIQARGQWRDVATRRIVLEESRVLVLVHDGGARADQAIREIVAEYKRRFEQDAVLRVDTAARVSF